MKLATTKNGFNDESVLEYRDVTCDDPYPDRTAHMSRCLVFGVLT